MPIPFPRLPLFQLRGHLFPPELAAGPQLLQPVLLFGLTRSPPRSGLLLRTRGLHGTTIRQLFGLAELLNHSGLRGSSGPRSLLNANWRRHSNGLSVFDHACSGWIASALPRLVLLPSLLSSARFDIEWQFDL